MYDGAPVPGSLLGWILLGVTVVVFAARAVRVETRAAGPRPTLVRVADGALDLACLLAVGALGVVLVRLVLAGMAGGDFGSGG